MSKLGSLIGGVVAMLLTLALPALVLLVVYHAAAPGDATAWKWARFAAWLVSIVAFLAVFLTIGLGLKGRTLGVLINERNRYSLSRLQMSLWTLLILPSLFIVLINNLYRPGSPEFAFDWQLLAVMGMSVASIVSTPMILSRKVDSVPAAQPATGATAAVTTALDVNAHPEEAGLKDLVLGEEIGNGSDIDIGRIQMLMISLMAVVVYAWMIGGTLLKSVTYLKEMPPFNETLLGLILVSHVGYLAGKFTPSANSKGQTTAELGRALLLSQKATDLVARAEQTAKDAVPNGVLDRQLGTLLPLARSLATEAAALPSLAGTDKFDAVAIGRLEGKWDALNGQLSALVGQRSTPDTINAPKPEIVRDVQRKLAARNFIVNASGIADTATFAAIDRFLSDRKMNRTELSSEPYRMFEELQSLMS
jgi:hypothetical protein